MDVRDDILNAAPSSMRSDEPTMARLLALGGLGLAVLGSIAVVANQYGPRIVGPTMGIFLTFVGIALLLYHAFRDSEFEFRMGYTALGLIGLIAGIILSFLPGRSAGENSPYIWGEYLIPYAPMVMALGLLFLIAAGRHAHSPSLTYAVNMILLAVGGSLTLVPLGLGLAKPDLLAGPGLLLALVGVMYVVSYLSRVGADDGLGRFIGMAIGLVGGLALYYAIARSIFPVMLNEGPRAVQTAGRNYDFSLVAIRLVFVIALLFVAFRFLKQKRWSPLVRCLAAIAAGSIALVLVIGCLTSTIAKPLDPFLVPGGLILGLLGLIYLAVSIGFCSDSPFVAMLKREVSGFFTSPIAYLVLIGVCFMTTIGYVILLNQIDDSASPSFRPQPPIFEPMVSQYWFAALGAAFLVCLIVPTITMRLLSEEKRTGTLEVLLTSPVNEWQIVLSKFLAAWFFYMLIWIPIGLYLVGLRFAGPSFDYRPLLSYYLAHAICGAGFVAMGLFFSSVTRNQIVAAVLTGAVMLGLLFTTVIKGLNFGEWFQPFAAVLSKFDFYLAWNSALSGQLSLSFLFVYLSFATFWLFLTTKVLEARRWA